MNTIDNLKKLIERYDNDYNFYRSNTYNESQLRTDFLDPLFALLGWDIQNNAGKATREREVLVEEGLKVSARDNTKKPDYTFRLFSERKFFLEAKKPSVDIKNDAEPAQQVRRYGFTAKLKISVLSNFEYIAIYDCSNQVSIIDTTSNSRIKLYHYKDFDEISQLIGKDSVYSGQFDIEWKNIEDKINLFSVDDLFLDQINGWRLHLAKEFLILKPSLKEEELNDLIQSYINSIVFLRVCEDRDIENYESLYNFSTTKNFQSLIKSLKESDKKYNSGLFDLNYVEELIKDDKSYIWTIIEQLYFPYSTYSFSIFSSDILGNIYEIFLSKKIVILPNKEIEIRPKEEHINRDVVTTPIFIVNEIIQNTVLKFCEEKTDKEILSSKFSDIACGSGAFLIEVFQAIQDFLIDYYIKNDEAQLERINITSYKLKFELKKKILTQCIYGIDKDLNAVKACSFGLLLKLLEGETKATINAQKPILPSLDKNILFGNSLISSIKKNTNENLLEINPIDINLKFDVIVGNPPYMATEHMKQLTPLELPIYKENYQSANKQFDKYYLFVERSLSLININGYIGYILPSKFIKVASASKLRKYLVDTESIFSMTSFGVQQIFKNKTTYTCLLFLRDKNQKKELQFNAVNDLAKWKINKNNVFTSKYNINQLNDKAWSLNSEVDDVLDAMYQKSKPLSEILGKKTIENGIQTSANKVYIHKVIKKENGFVFFEYKGITYEVEEELTRPYFETERSNEGRFYTYKDVEPNAIVIYPYKKINNRIVLVDYTDLQASYPKMFDFLHVIKDSLDNIKRSIEPKPLTANEWYIYGRSQSLENCDVPQKIIVGVLSNGYKYSIDNNQTFVSSGGTAGYSIINVPDNIPYSIYYIQALLTSRYLEWFASIYGEEFRGGYIARGTKIQKQMPIPIIDFNNPTEKDKHDDIAKLQEEMSETYSKIINADSRTKITLERSFEAMKVKMDGLIKNLYDLGDLDQKIPTIEKLYDSIS